jgi:hypothetical protein
MASSEMSADGCYDRGGGESGRSERETRNADDAINKEPGTTNIEVRLADGTTPTAPINDASADDIGVAAALFKTHSPGFEFECWCIGQTAPGVVAGHVHKSSSA